LMAASPWWTLLFFLVIGIGLLFAASANSDSGLGILFVLLFSFLCGLLLSVSITQVLQLAAGVKIIAMAFGGTILALVGCSIVAVKSKTDFSGMGGFLFGSLIAVIALIFANALFFKLSALALIISSVVVVLFTAFLVYDVQAAVQGRVTYIEATINIYLDILNIFSALLDIFSAIFGNASDFLD